MKTQHLGRKDVKEYLLALSTQTALSPELEYRLLKAAVLGSEEAAREIAESYLPKVVAIAARYRGYGLDFKTLIELGNRGLFRAMKRWQEGDSLEALILAEVEASMKRSVEKTSE